MEKIYSLEVLINRIKTLWPPPRSEIGPETKTSIISLQSILKDYLGNDWEKYIEYSPKTYTRILLCSDHSFELLLICWDKKQSSRIHNHPKKGCILKVLSTLSGLTERKYSSDKIFTSSRKLLAGDVSYIDDSLGLHQILNGDSQSVSLHLYSPRAFNRKSFIHKLIDV